MVTTARSNRTLCVHSDALNAVSKGYLAANWGDLLWPKRLWFPAQGMPIDLPCCMRMCMHRVVHSFLSTPVLCQPKHSPD
jgi:hypothetical protein